MLVSFVYSKGVRTDENTTTAFTDQPGLVRMLSFHVINQSFSGLVGFSVDRAILILFIFDRFYDVCPEL